MTTIIVEDGSIVEGANSYGDRASFIAYALARGVVIADDDQADVALIIAMDWLETQPFPGHKTTQEQTTQWPRTGAVIGGYPVADDEIPRAVIETQFEAGIAYQAGYNPLGAQERLVKRVRVGQIEKEYIDNGDAYQQMPRALFNKLSIIIAPTSTGFEFTVGIG